MNFIKTAVEIKLLKLTIKREMAGAQGFAIKTTILGEYIRNKNLN